MCQAPIGKVIQVSEGKLIVECKGKTLELRSKLAHVKNGDYVIFSSGLAIDKMDSEEAEMIFGR